LDCDVLRVRQLRDAPNVTVDLRAVSDQTGSASYYATRASVFASLLPPAPALHALPGAPTEVLETVDVDTIRLDDLVREPVSVVKTTSRAVSSRCSEADNA